MSSTTRTLESTTLGRPKWQRRLLAAAAGTLLLAAGTSAHASLVLLGAENFAGSGLGAVNTILTMQSPGSSSFGTASVAVDTLTNIQVQTGDAKTGTSQTQLRTLDELGVSSASNLRIVFNASEPGGNGITLNDLVLNIYSPTGTVLWSSGAFVAVSFADTMTGVGNSGFVFGLDAEQAAAAQAAAFSGGSFGANRLGLSASASGATGGLETFYVSAAPVPEPSSWALMLGAGLFGGLMVLRRKHGQQN